MNSKIQLATDSEVKKLKLRNEHFFSVINISHNLITLAFFDNQIMSFIWTEW